MHKIKLLSEKSINQIAAGEVVERPLSVVKELIENSIDAGATSIKIEIEDSGKSLIAIHDNGCGMSQDDLKLCVERHATSKLDESRIEYINTLGFRGEALPSIGSISNLKITSRVHHSKHASEINLNGGAKSQVIPASRDFGTSLEVRNLFSYTPARLKFLKSDRTEKAAILNLVQSFALCNPHIYFQLIYDSNAIFSSVASEKLDQTLISNVFGEEFGSKMVAIDVKTDYLQIHGFVGLPTFAHSNMNNQFMFVNGRIVKDKLITQAMRAAYYNLMSEGKHSAFILSLTIDPYEIDVNVHPAKTEIRFREPDTIKSIIIKQVRERFKDSSVHINTSQPTIQY
ncbi:MAG: DNA mismatch repair endonuclease MutL, partial [Alphaproteobacteria bacterium]